MTPLVQSRPKHARWWRLILLVGLAVTTLATGTVSAQEAVLRYRPRPSPARKPAGVPSDFVLTRAGFFHPSCVITVASDEIVGRDGDDMVVRDKDGGERFRKGPCNYPRYRRSGRLFAPRAGNPDTTAPDWTTQTSHSAYDGWVVSYRSDGSFDPRSTLVTEWHVPALPSKVADQDIAFFNAIMTTADNGDILQPVLDFSEIPGKWAIESEHCCIGGNDSQSTLVEVRPGDRIRGTIAPSNCDATGFCSSWKIVTQDLTTNQMTVNNTTETGGRAVSVNPAALESYGITACDMFPANGEITFFNNALRSPTGATATLTDKLNIVDHQQTGSGLPLDCGYAGTALGTSYTLVWAASHYPMASATATGSASDRDASAGIAPGDNASINTAGSSADAGSGGGGDELASVTDAPGCTCGVARKRTRAGVPPLLMGGLGALAVFEMRRRSRSSVR